MKKYALLSLTILMLTNTMTLVQATESRDNENLPANLIYSQANQALEGDFLHDRLLTGEIDNALEQGWKNSDAIINAIKKDKRAIELFKKAALQKSNREMFVLSPEKVSIEMVVPNFYKEIILFKLVLIEAEILAKKGRVDDAEENYLAAARFMLHASEEKFQNILTKLFELIYMEVSYPAFTRMANNKDISAKSLMEIKSIFDQVYLNQDDFKKAFESEKEWLINSINSIYPNEFGYPQNKTFALFKSKKKKEEITKRLYSKISDNFSEKINKHFDALYLAIKGNDIEIYKKHSEKFLLRIKKYKPFGPFKAIFYSIFGMEDKFAEEIAFILCSVGLADYEKIIYRYHINLSRMNLLRVALSCRNYEWKNKQMPEKLEQLIPKWFSEIPQDAFNNFKPLSVTSNEQGLVLYSFGLDKEDDNAESILSWEAFNEDNARIDGDIVLTLE